MPFRAKFFLYDDQEAKAKADPTLGVGVEAKVEAGVQIETKIEVEAEAEIEAEADLVDAIRDPLPDLDRDTRARVLDHQDQGHAQDPDLPLSSPVVQGLPPVQISERRNGRVVEEGVVANAKEVTIDTDDVLQTITATTETGGGKFHIVNQFSYCCGFRTNENDSKTILVLCRSKSPPNSYRRPYDNWYDREKQRQLQERRIVYVGCLDEGITKADLRRRFEAFGPIVDTSVHFREHGDNYGFVIFAYKNDAYEAIEHGNDDPTLPRYELCFGGRRAFCKVKYADLDGLASNSLNGSSLSQNNEDNTFDLLLKEAKAKLRKRKYTKKACFAYLQKPFRLWSILMDDERIM
ncbi:hypothetical protein HZH68_006313 [Vespula germanica]|uniref:RRM domain-containing protein n=1 Tax=Vespula germanica TaxID=30212 RepID=A0A834NCX1_VESGE|nr:hypothetical protein HZH68_006313 [Vespula germanica]